jgi:hypothetical protein
VQLNPIDKEEAAEEIMNRGGETADEVVDKTNPILDWRRGVAFFARKANGAFLLHQAQPLHQVDVLVGDF